MVRLGLIVLLVAVVGVGLGVAGFFLPARQADVNDMIQPSVVELIEHDQHVGPQREIPKPPPIVAMI
jgi:hypothetical protein